MVLGTKLYCKQIPQIKINKFSHEYILCFGNRWYYLQFTNLRGVIAKEFHQLLYLIELRILSLSAVDWIFCLRLTADFRSI